MARRTKLTKALIEAICGAIRGGAYITAACGSMKIPRRTFYGWKEQGEEERLEGKNTIFVQFLDAVEHAEADNEIMLVESIMSDMDWRAKMEILKRRYTERWGDKTRTELTGAGGEPLPSAQMPPITIIHQQGDEIPDFIDETDKVSE